MRKSESVLSRHPAEPQLLAAGLIASFLVVVTPMLLFDHAALLDYQNHLARIWLIASAPQSDGYYEVDWHDISNGIGVDVVALALGGLVSPDRIARICLILAVALPPVGVVLLSRRIFGRINPFCLLVPFFAWTLTALAGFLNFQIGLGLALIAVAADPLLGDTWWTRLIGRTLFGLLILLDHGLALTFYMILLIGVQLGSIDEPISLRTLKRDAPGALGAGAATLIALLLMVVFTHTVPGSHDPSRYTRQTTWNTHRTMLMALASPLSTYDFRIDVIIALALACLVIAYLHSGKTSCHSGLLLMTAGMYTLSVFMPKGTPYGGWTDRRFPVMALLTVLASVRITFPSPRKCRLLGSLAICLVITRTAWIGWNWAGGQAMEKSTLSALSAMAPGTRLLSVQYMPSKAELSSAPPGRFIYGDEITYRHLPTLAVALKHAFVPTLFTQLGVHPVHVKPAWRVLSNPEGGNLPPVGALTDESLIGSGTAYVRGWRTTFDYVLILNADFPDASGSGRLPAELRLVSDNGFAKLFSVTRDGK